MTSGTRLLLATTALAATWIDPTEPSRFVEATYAVLALYLAYAALLYLAVRRDAVHAAALRYSLPWIDVGVYAVLIGLSGGVNSIYYVLFFFGILIASFQGGFGYGVAVTAVSVLLFVVVGYASRPADPFFDLNRFLLRSAALPVLGYLISYQGGYERRLRSRLALLRDMSTLSNPRYGPHRMLARSLERLRAFYDADLSVAVLSAPDGEGYQLCRVTRGGGNTAPDAEPISTAFAAALLPFDADERVCFRTRFRPGFRTGFRTDGSRSIVSSAVEPRGDAFRDRRPYERVAELLGAAAYLTVPLRAEAGSRGRIFIAGSDPMFDADAGDFLLQAADQIMPALTHIALVERMATRAAEDERQRIALDIHDRIIQPYIGLQIGIGAVEQLASNAADATALPVVRERLAKLSRLTALGVTDLRGYVQGLRDSPASASGLLDSLERFGRRFQEATGIEVVLDAEGDVSVDHRLAEEVFSMASEAVSNVRRHTNAPSVRIVLRQTDERLVLRVENPDDPDRPRGTFVPQSMAQRAAACNGTITVESADGGGTAVIVEIPL